MIGGPWPRAPLLGSASDIQLQRDRGWHMCEQQVNRVVISRIAAVAGRTRDIPADVLAIKPRQYIAVVLKRYFSSLQAVV